MRHNVFRAKRVQLRREAAAEVHHDAAKIHPPVEMLDHHAIGRDQELWFSHAVAPGAPFFLPSGAHIYNKLIALMRGECLARGYYEVLSPQLLSAELFDRSGHSAHYAKDMFLFDHDGRRVGLKPMSCPCHCLMFGAQVRSYRDLPLRLAEFGVVHRDECSGALSGLRRVVRFCQDDAHIFCEEAMIADEVLAVLDFQRSVYARLGLRASYELASRPEKSLQLGKDDDGMWQRAEAALGRALDAAIGPRSWSIDEGGGAFYGPKIDIKVADVRGAALQCASIQLDFQMPVRLGCRYVDAHGARRVPVMIHREILGSIERMFAVLAERYQGEWPFWISPHQALVMPVSAADDAQCAHAKRVHQQLRAAGYAVAIDLSQRSMRVKVKEAEGHGPRGRLWRHHLILVVGSKEVEGGAVNVKAAGAKQGQAVSLDDLCAFFARREAGEGS